MFTLPHLGIFALGLFIGASAGILALGLMNMLRQYDNEHCQECPHLPVKEQIAELIRAHWWEQWEQERDSTDSTVVTASDLALARRIMNYVRVGQSEGNDTCRGNYRDGT